MSLTFSAQLGEQVTETVNMISSPTLNQSSCAQAKTAALKGALRPQ
jgi:hypothetical protein